MGWNLPASQGRDTNAHAAGQVVAVPVVDLPFDMFARSPQIGF